MTNVSGLQLTHEGCVTLIAGPCAIENYEQLDCVAEVIAQQGLHWMRGGAFKPRTSPFSFQGLGFEGVEILRNCSSSRGLHTLSEVVDEHHVWRMSEEVDALQIGARNMTNYELLKAVSSSTEHHQVPVLFKRGMASTIDEWIQSAEYLTQDGNENIVLCERGIRTFETATRFTLDIATVPIVQQRTRFPICVDVSHPAGQAALVPALAKAAVAAGADAIMVEVHPTPRDAKSDAGQQLSIKQFVDLVSELRILVSSLDKELI